MNCLNNVGSEAFEVPHWILLSGKIGAKWCRFDWHGFHPFRGIITCREKGSDKALVAIITIPVLALGVVRICGRVWQNLHHLIKVIVGRLNDHGTRISFHFTACLSRTWSGVIKPMHNVGTNQNIPIQNNEPVKVSHVEHPKFVESPLPHGTGVRYLFYDKVSVDLVNVLVWSLHPACQGIPFFLVTHVEIFGNNHNLFDTTAAAHVEFGHLRPRGKNTIQMFRAIYK
mmetsp:Transcript_7038/g.12628  ORF Transcript_7038/g.12628 Transcript_7038/m.12628 type:complete len:228 (-) Transcript_7038:35-718(-)